MGRFTHGGGSGSVVGVSVLANVDGDVIRPYLAVLLVVVGIRIVVRFSRPKVISALEPPAGDGAVTSGDFNRRGIAVAGFLGGITNGLIGAWGPVVTPVLLHRDGLEPRVAIGSANTAEVAVALTASGSLLATLDGAGVELDTAIAMLAGGVFAALIAAWAVRHIAPTTLGVGAGLLLLVVNLRELAGWADIGALRWLAYTAALAACAAALWRARTSGRARQALAA